MTPTIAVIMRNNKIFTAYNNSEKAMEICVIDPQTNSVEYIPCYAMPTESDRELWLDSVMEIYR